MRSTPQFWKKLGNGDFQSGEFRRIAKGGVEIWIQATYNPIRDMNGKPFKVVKYATDITGMIHERHRRQTAQSEISQQLDQIGAIVESATQQASGATDAANTTSTNVQAVASGAEELSSSIGEISRQVNTGAGNHH